MDLGYNSPISQATMGMAMGLVAAPLVITVTDAAAEAHEYQPQDFQKVIYHYEYNCQCTKRTVRTVRLKRAPKTVRLLG